jgi:uncharacterized protein DUF4382
MWFKILALPIVLLGLAVPLVACDSSGQVEVGLSAADPMETSEIPGAPVTTERPKLWVTVEAVKVHLVLPENESERGESADNEPTEPRGDEVAEAAAEGGEWLTVFSGSRSIDLYDAVGTEAFLGSLPVPVGRIDQVRLVLAPDASLVAGGVTLAVTCPSCSESGLKITIPGGLEVAPGGMLHLTLVVSIRKSIRIELDRVMLRPVIRIEMNLEGRSASDL